MSTRTGFLYFFIIIVVFGAFMFWYAQDAYRVLPLNKQQVVNFEKHNVDSWKEFHASDRSFSVLLPTSPQHVVERIIDPTREHIKEYSIYAAEEGDGTMYMITSTTFTELPETPANIMKKMKNDMIKALPDAVLLNQNSLTHKGFDTLDYSFKNSKKRFDVRSFVDGKTLYVLHRVTEVDINSPGEFTYFLNSFELNK